MFRCTHVRHCNPILDIEPVYFDMQIFIKEEVCVHTCCKNTIRNWNSKLKPIPVEKITSNQCVSRIFYTPIIY